MNEQQKGIWTGHPQHKPGKKRRIPYNYKV